MTKILRTLQQLTPSVALAEVAGEDREAEKVPAAENALCDFVTWNSVIKQCGSEANCLLLYVTDHSPRRLLKTVSGEDVKVRTTTTTASALSSTCRRCWRGARGRRRYLRRNTHCIILWTDMELDCKEFFRAA